MQEMTAQSWKRRGCSIVWSPELLTPLIVEAEATPLRTALEWQRHGLTRIAARDWSHRCLLVACRPQWRLFQSRTRAMRGFVKIFFRYAECGATIGLALALSLAWTALVGSFNSMSLTNWFILAKDRIETTRCV